MMFGKDVVLLFVLFKCKGKCIDMEIECESI